MLNAHDDLDHADDDLNAPPESAACLLARVKPFPHWLAEHRRTAAEIDLYHYVVSNLEANQPEGLCP
jgi:hypothetical protein